MLARLLVAAALIVLPFTSSAATPPDMAAKAVASVKRAVKWDRVEVQRAKANDYALIIWYKAAPASHNEVEKDTSLVARAMLNVLVAEKVIQNRDDLHIVVRGRMPAKGETGASLTRVFGVTRYDASNDQLKFEKNR
jgi:hypothetical protein